MWKDTTVLIDIEGTDGSGKETQSKLLQEVLQRRGLAVGLLHFPQYGTPSASIIEKYLSGGYGENPSAVNPRAASMMYALDRFDAFNAVDSRLNTRPLDVVILDRYTYSNIIHQCSKFPYVDVRVARKMLFDTPDDSEYGRYMQNCKRTV